MHIGVDEAGRGPVMGPMVVAAVAVHDQGELESLGVRDSKKLTPQRREELSEIIKRRYPHSVLVVEAEEIDDLRAVMTMNRLETKLFAKVIQMVMEGVEGEHELYLDAADTVEGRFGEMVVEELTKMLWRKPPLKNVVAEHGADNRYPVVSAASIIAKVERDRRIKILAEKIGDFGSGYPSDKRTIRFLKEYYEKHGVLPPGVRRTWRTIRHLIKERSQSTLEGF